MSRLWVGRLSRRRTSSTTFSPSVIAAVLCILQSGDATQQRRLSAAAGAEQHEEHSIVDGEIDVVDGDDLVLAGIDLQQVLDPQRLHGALYIFFKEFETSRPDRDEHPDEGDHHHQ